MAVTDCIRTCRHCCVEFQRTAKGQPTAYCGMDCKRAEYVKRYSDRRVNKNRAPHKPKLVVCAYCHREAYRRVRGGKSDSGRFCSRECAFACISHMAAERAALKRIASNWAWKPSPLVLSEVAALRRIAAYIERPRLFMVDCMQCGAETVVRRNGGLHRKTCTSCRAESERRARRACKARRRAAKRGNRCERFDPIEVLERDKWRCQMCGVITPKRLRGTHGPRAPELDHVIPLALGGEHSRANTQCACRSCNQAKGATPLGQIGMPFAA